MQEENLINLIDGYVEKGGHHLNVNVFNRDTLLDAQAHPEKYPQLTVRVSGYAVNFIKVKQGRDLGDKIEILEGLNGNEKLITNITDDLQEGQKVKFKEN